MNADARRRDWPDERIHNEFEAVRRDFDVKHKQNQADIESLKASQAGLVRSVHDGFATVDWKQERSLLLLTQIIGQDGEPGRGRLGILETTVEGLKKFRWQAIAIIAAGLAVLSFIFKR